jgi:hypothetical protein
MTDELPLERPVRPECFEFAMDFLGGPEDEEVRAYVDALEDWADAAVAACAAAEREACAKIADDMDYSPDGRIAAAIRGRAPYPGT